MYYKGLSAFTRYPATLVRLLIFIDESGTTSETEHNLTLASAWCVPTTKEGYQSVLRFTADEAKAEIRQTTGSWPNEIHFSSGLMRCVDTIFEKVVASSYQDNSIHRNDLPWTGKPLAYRTVAYCPKIEFSLKGYDKNTFHKNLRARGIISLLMPLLSHNGRPNIEASVILDANVWGEAVSICRECLNGPLSANSVAVTFSCEDSNRVPGLQIADLAAGIVRHHLIDGTCNEAFKSLDAGIIHRLGKSKKSEKEY